LREETKSDHFLWFETMNNEDNSTELSQQLLRDRRSHLLARQEEWLSKPASSWRSAELERIRSQLKSIDIRLSPTGKRRAQRSEAEKQARTEGRRNNNKNKSIMSEDDSNKDQKVRQGQQRNYIDTIARRPLMETRNDSARNAVP